MKRYLVLSAAFTFVVLFGYLHQAGAQVSKDPNCPGEFIQSYTGCVDPGQPDPKDGVTTPSEFQSMCRDSTKAQAHGRPAAIDVCDPLCGKMEECWVCCAKPLLDTPL